MDRLKGKNSRKKKQNYREREIKKMRKERKIKEK